MSANAPMSREHRRLFDGAIAFMTATVNDPPAFRKVPGPIGVGPSLTVVDGRPVDADLTSGSAHPTTQPAGTGVNDRWGVPVFTADSEALEAWDLAVEQLAAFAGDPAGSARSALDADAGFAEARAFCAYVELYAQTPAGQAAARALLVAAPSPGAARGTLHLAAAGAWAAGDLEGAALRLEDALVVDPRDLLALRVVQDLYFFLGDTRSLRDSAARVVRSWPESAPGWGRVQGIYSFGLEEAGLYRRAEAAALASLAADPADVWAVHSMAHIAEMEGRPGDGAADLTARSPHWASSYFAVHNWWHLGLFLIAEGRLDDALALYDDTIRAQGTGAWLDVVDAASLLWRLALVGVDVAGRAVDLVDVLRPLAGSGISAFNDWHAVMVFALARRDDLAGRVAAGLDRATGTNARVVAATGRAVIGAFRHFGVGDHAAAAEGLFATRVASRALGGSHAQRDEIDLTLLAAAASAGHDGLVRALGDERLETRPAAAAPLEQLLAARRA
jgi:tetratricopeptide (TPR) repeat protein